MKKYRVSGGNPFRSESVGKYTSKEVQTKVWSSFNGLKWSEVKTLLQSLHPIQELVMTCNIFGSVSTIDHKGIGGYVGDILEGYINDEFSFEDFKRISRTMSNMMFEKASECGVSPDKIFFKEDKVPIVSPDCITMVID